MGNRGILHDDERRVIRARSSVRSWVCCLTDFKGRKRRLMAPGKYTELFFLDEATALAAGHRPCGECQRRRYVEFKEAWARAFGNPPSAKDLAARLFPEMKARLDGAPLLMAHVEDLPAGVMVEREAGVPELVWGKERTLVRWSHHGYTGAEIVEPSREVRVITPPSTVAVMAAGFTPKVHESVSQLE